MVEMGIQLTNIIKQYEVTLSQMLHVHDIPEDDHMQGISTFIRCYATL